MTERLMIRYRLKPSELDNHLELLRAVYRELESTSPDDLSYVSYQLDDDLDFVDIAIGPALPGPLPGLAAFQRYRRDLESRCDERVVSDLRVVESYRFGTEDMLGNDH